MLQVWCTSTPNADNHNDQYGANPHDYLSVYWTSDVVAGTTLAWTQLARAIPCDSVGAVGGVGR